MNEHDGNDHDEKSMTAKATTRSLVLVTVDCLRADHCGFYGYSRPTTPFLDSLAAESVVVEHAMVAGAPTYYSLPAIHASRMPLALGRDVIGLAPGEPTLATTLAQHGYATAAFSAANPYISPQFGYDQGFELFRDFFDFEAQTLGSKVEKSSGERDFRSSLNSSSLNAWVEKSARRAGMGQVYDELYFQYRMRIAASPVASIDQLRKFPSADVIVDSAETWLSSLDERPFFLWIHLMDPHHPYYPKPEAIRDLMGRDISPGKIRYLNESWNRADSAPNRLQKKKEAVIELYDAGIRWVDSQIARLVSCLKRLNRWEECVLALTADHGEEFLDHGHRYHAPVSLAEEIVRVPLLLRVPQQAGRKSSGVFSLLHLAPTVLDVLGISPPAEFQGTSLWGRLKNNSAVEAGLQNEWQDSAVAECVYGCTNPFLTEARLSPRLLCVREGQYKLVMRLEVGMAEEIYDVEKDPREKSPLPTDATRQMRGRFLRIAKEHVEKMAANDQVVARMKTRLRDLQLEFGG